MVVPRFGSEGYATIQSLGCWLEVKTGELKIFSVFEPPGYA